MATEQPNVDADDESRMRMALSAEPDATSKLDELTTPMTMIGDVGTGISRVANPGAGIGRDG